MLRGLRVFSRVARQGSTLNAVGEGFGIESSSYWLQLAKGLSGGQQPEGDGKKQQPKADEEEEEKAQQQPFAHLDASKNAQLQKYLEQLKGSTQLQKDVLGEQERPWWQQLIVGAFERWLQRWVADVIRARVEQEFSMEEFLEGAKDAYFMVNYLLTNDDFDTLANGMLSAKLLEALRATKSEYQAAGFGWRTELRGGVAAGLRGLSFWSREEMQQYDPARAQEAPAADTPEPALPPRLSGMWLVLTVQLRAEQHVSVARLEDGKLEHEVTDHRPQLWKFATGPLPEGLPVRRLETPWFLVTI